MKITIGYPVAFGCNLRTRDGVKTHAIVSFVEAHSIDEAIGVGIMRAKEMYPYADGYTDHWSIATHISADRGWFQQKLDESEQETDK